MQTERATQTKANSQTSSLDRNCVFQHSYKTDNAENARNVYTEMLSIRILAGARTRFGVHACVKRWFC
eukprot:3984037-Pleurochrysis_carterae.AAC.1